MRIGVLLHWNEGEESGVFKKVISQIRTWRAQGVLVSLHIVSRRPMLKVWQHYLKETPITLHLYSGVDRFWAWKDAVKALKAHCPDVVYCRYDLYMPALKSLSQDLPLILEINTNDLTEYRLTKRWLRYWYNRFTRSLLLRQASGLVFVTWELSESPDFSKYQKPFVVISNGIDLEDFLPLPAARNEEPRLIFLGTDRHAWHGVDKILRMATLFPKWQFDIVGVQPNNLQRVPKNVHIYGPLDRQAYRTLIAHADIAIGTLALHRIKMNEACPLKVREYLAYGLPVIIGYKDTDFLNGAPFILELPNTEDNIESNVTRIVDFIFEWKGKRVPREALYHLDLRVKESQRLAFFKNILEGKL